MGWGAQASPGSRTAIVARLLRNPGVTNRMQAAVAQRTGFTGS
jgi:hypothetical protein